MIILTKCLIFTLSLSNFDKKQNKTSKSLAKAMSSGFPSHPDVFEHPVPDEIHLLLFITFVLLGRLSIRNLERGCGNMSVYPR